MKITWSQIPKDISEEVKQVLLEASDDLYGLIKDEERDTMKPHGLRCIITDGISVISVLIAGVISTSFILPVIAKGLMITLSVVFCFCTLIYNHITLWSEEDIPKNQNRIEEYKTFRTYLGKTLDLIYLVCGTWKIHDVIEESNRNEQPLKVKAYIEEHKETCEGIIQFKKAEYTKKTKDMETILPGINYKITMNKDLFYRVVKDDHIDFSEIDKEFIEAATEMKRAAILLDGSTFNQERLADLSESTTKQLMVPHVIYL